MIELALPLFSPCLMRVFRNTSLVWSWLLFDTPLLYCTSIIGIALVANHYNFTIPCTIISLYHYNMPNFKPFMGQTTRQGVPWSKSDGHIHFDSVKPAQLIGQRPVSPCHVLNTPGVYPATVTCLQNCRYLDCSKCTLI